MADVKKGTGQDQVPLSGGAAETKNSPFVQLPFPPLRVANMSCKKIVHSIFMRYHFVLSTEPFLLEKKCVQNLLPHVHPLIVTS